MLAGPGYQQSERSLRSVFDTIVEVSQLLREARVTLYNINAFDPASSGQMMRMDYYKSFLKPVKSVHEAQTGNLSVPVFAVQSGGQVFNATGDLAAFISKCVAEAKPTTRSASIRQAPSTRMNTTRLEVTVDKPGLKARTNTGYYAEPLPKP